LTSFPHVDVILHVFFLCVDVRAVDVLVVLDLVGHPQVPSIMI